MPCSDRTYDVTIVGKSGLSEHSVAWYREHGFDYLVASSFIYNIPLVYKEKDVARRAFYASLEDEFELVMAFGPYRRDAEASFVFAEIYGPAVSLWQRQRPGPTLRVYRVE